MARPERFELPTYSSGGCRSIQLSYGRAIFSLHPHSGIIKCLAADTLRFTLSHELSSEESTSGYDHHRCVRARARRHRLCALASDALH
jgi:hypothetical protein